MKPPALIHVPPAQAETVEPHTALEVAELLGVAEDDLVWVPFAVRGVMWMSRARQLDDDVALNVSAMVVLQKMAHPGLRQMAVRGEALVFPGGVPWGPLPGDERAAEQAAPRSDR